MAQRDETLTRFQTRANQMLLHYRKVKQDNIDLRVTLDSREREISRLRQQIAELDAKYRHLKMARLLEVSSDDTEAARARLAKLIRDVNRAITLLTKQE